MKIEQLIKLLKDNPVCVYNDEQKNKPILYNGSGGNIPIILYTKSITSLSLAIKDEKPVIEIFCADSLPRKTYIGKTSVTKTGRKMKIIDYIGLTNITVEFEDGTVLPKQTMYKFKSGTIKHPDDIETAKAASNSKKDQRTGITEEQNGEKITIIDYATNTDMTVQFEDGTVVYGISWNQFQDKRVPKIRLENYKWKIINSIGIEREISADEAVDFIKNDTIPNNQRWALRRQHYMFGISKNRVLQLKIKIKSEDCIIKRINPLKQPKKGDVD